MQITLAARGQTALGGMFSYPTLSSSSPCSHLVERCWLLSILGAIFLFCGTRDIRCVFLRSFPRYFINNPASRSLIFPSTRCYSALVECAALPRAWQALPKVELQRTYLFLNACPVVRALMRCLRSALGKGNQRFKEKPSTSLPPLLSLSLSGSMKRENEIQLGLGPPPGHCISLS